MIHHLLTRVSHRKPLTSARERLRDLGRQDEQCARGTHCLEGILRGRRSVTRVGLDELEEEVRERSSREQWGVGERVLHQLHLGRLHTGERMAGGDAQRVQIARWGRAADHLLHRHVARCPDDGGAADGALHRILHGAKVHEVCLTVGVEQDVRGLEVPVDDGRVAAVEGDECLEQTLEQCLHAIWRPGAGAKRFVEGGAVDELLDDDHLEGVFALHGECVQVAGDAVELELREDLRLALEQLDGFPVLRVGECEHLERDLLAGRAAGRQVGRALITSA